MGKIQAHRTSKLYHCCTSRMYLLRQGCTPAVQTPWCILLYRLRGASCCTVIGVLIRPYSYTVWCTTGSLALPGPNTDRLTHRQHCPSYTVQRRYSLYGFVQSGYFRPVGTVGDDQLCTCCTVWCVTDSCTTWYSSRCTSRISPHNSLGSWPFSIYRPLRY